MFILTQVSSAVSASHIHMCVIFCYMLSVDRMTMFTAILNIESVPWQGKKKGMETLPEAVYFLKV